MYHDALNMINASSGDDESVDWLITLGSLVASSGVVSLLQAFDVDHNLNIARHPITSGG